MRINTAAVFIPAVLILVSCIPAVTPPLASTATAVSSATPARTSRPSETAAASITPPPVTFLEGLKNIPKPDDRFIQQVISRDYLRALQITSEQVVIEYIEHTGLDGQPFVVMLDSSTGVPLAVYDGQWSRATLKFFGNLNGIKMGTDTVENPGLEEIEVSKNFERATIQAGNEWFRIEPEKGKIDPSQAESTEALIQLLKSKTGIVDIVGHPIISLYPDWLVRGDFSQDEMRVILHDRIEYELTNHPDIQSWVVVNEPYLDCECGRENDPFYKAWGNSYDYIVEAFQMAHEINPDAALIYNDTDNHHTNGGTAQMTRDIVARLHEKGLVDYVGMEMHLNQWGGVNAGKVDTAAISNEIAYYKSLGVPVLITELTYEPTEAELNLPAQEFDERLSTIFEQIFNVAIESKNVEGITFWGLTDRYIKDINWFIIFDEQGQPKRSYYTVLKTLYEGIK